MAISYEHNHNPKEKALPNPLQFKASKGLKYAKMS